MITIKPELYWKGLTSAQKADMAEKLNKAPLYLQRCMTGHAKPSANLTAMIIEYAAVAGREIKRWELRPDLYGHEEWA